MGATLDRLTVIGSFALMRDILARTRHKPISFGNGWDTTNVGGGVVVGSNFMNCTLRSSATINSSTLFRLGPIWGWNWAGGTASLFDWSKPSSFYFDVRHSASDAQSVSRVQFKETNGTLIAILAERGVGLQLDNLALTGEAYGTSRGTVDLATTMTAGYVYRIEIRLDDTGCEFFVNNVSKGKLTTAGQFPALMATAECDAYVTHANGAAGTNTDFEAGNMAILQAS